MITIELVTDKNIDEYDEFLESNKESVCQQTTAWMNVIKNISPDTPIFLMAKENDKIVAAMPNYLYKSEMGNIIVSIPHAGPYGGIICDASDKSKIYESLTAKLFEIAKDNNCCLATIITPPFFSDFNIYNSAITPDYAVENFYQFIDLENFSPKRDVKRRIEESKNNGLVISEDSSMDNILEWYEIHKKRMGELNARSLPLEIFIKSAKMNKSKFFFVLKDKKIISGTMLIFHNQVIDVYMISMDSDYDNLLPNFFLMDNVIRWAKLEGFKYMNWESSPSRDSGTYLFKSRWGSLEGKHHILTKVLGNINKLKQTSLEDVKKAYPWHYVLPYSLWGVKSK